MGVVRIRVHDTLPQVLENIRKQIATDLKREYGLKEVEIHGTVASQILAAKASGKNFISYNIKKVGLNKGVLRLL